VSLCIGFPFFRVGILPFRQWLYDDAGWAKPDGGLSDPDDFTLTKLRINEPGPVCEPAAQFEQKTDRTQ
jgi:hypothetical protein